MRHISLLLLRGLCICYFTFICSSNIRFFNITSKGNCSKGMSTTALWCVQYLPEARPSMSNIVKNLEGGAEIATPPNPFPHLASLTAEVPYFRDSSSNSTIECETIEDDKDYSTMMKTFEIESIAQQSI